MATRRWLHPLPSHAPPRPPPQRHRPRYQSMPRSPQQLPRSRPQRLLFPNRLLVQGPHRPRTHPLITVKLARAALVPALARRRTPKTRLITT